MKQRLLRSFSFIGWRGFAGQMCLCFGLFCFVACCWVSRATLVVLKDHPLYRQDLLLGVVCGGGVLCENCIVDANAIIIMATAIMFVVVCFSFLWFLFLVFFVVCA